jgi:hypothetical protein
MRTVYATVLSVHDANDVHAALDLVGRWITDWYARFRVNVDDVVAAIGEGEIDAMPMAGHRLVIRSLQTTERPNERVIDLRWSYPDQYDKSLGWYTNLTLYRTADRLDLALEVCVTGLSFKVAPANIKLGSPRLVRDISRLRSVYLAGRAYSKTPEVIQAPEVDDLVAELVLQQRAHPVVVVSRRTRQDAPLIDSSALAESLAGVAKVYELADKWAAYKLDELVGRELACFDGAIRIYWPGFTLTAKPYAHPLWLAKSLSTDEMAARSQRQLCTAVFNAASFRFSEPQEITDFRRLADREERQSARQPAADAADVDKLLHDLYDMEERLKTAQADNDALREQVKRHEENIAALTSPGMWDAAPAVDEPAPGPEAVEEGEPVVTVAAAVRRAAEENDHLTFLQSAFSSAEDSPFRHPERALQALQAINEVAGVWQNSLKSKKSVGSLKDHFKKLGFTYADDVSQTSGNRYGDEYEAKDGGRTYDISPHITIGAKQADSCLSIHWAWDESTGKAVVAHVGRHKTNTSS